METKQKLTPELEDIRYLQKKLEETHFDLYRNVREKTLTKSLEKVANVEPKYFKIALQESLALLEDAHTYVPGILNGNYPPIESKEIDGKFYIIGASKQYTTLIGHEIKLINGLPLEEVIQKVSELSSNENQEVLLKNIPIFMTSNLVLEYYGLSKSNVTEITTDIGHTILNVTKDTKVKTKNPLKWKENKLDDPTFLGNKDYRLRIVGDNLLFQYNSCTYENHTKEELRDFKNNLLKIGENVNTIIVDLRQNGGGNTSVMEDLFKRLPNDKKIYVAIGRKTFSSAIHHLLYLKNNKNAILIGENAGQRPNRFGDHKVIELPNSHIRVNCSFKYFELLPGQDIDVIEPDIRIPITIEDYKDEKDPLNQWIEKNL